MRKEQGMRYHWKRYDRGDAALVDSWLDALAIRETGLEDGWQAFYDYWMAESGTGEGKDRCFLIGHGGAALGVLYVAVTGREITISEYLLAPDMRGKGHGTAVLKEFLEHASRLMETNVAVARAVIYPDNLASRNAFEKAGFSLTARYQDEFGAGLHYEYAFV